LKCRRMPGQTRRDNLGHSKGEFHMPFAPVENGQLFYQFDGSSELPILLLSNSLGSDHSMWDLQMPSFTQHFRVLRYDSRGHGASSVTPGDYTIEMLGKDVLALCGHLKLPAVLFCGLSMGGVLGQWLGLHAPERFRKLVLCNTAAQIGTAEGWNARIADVRRGGVAAVSELILGRWLTARYREAHPEMADRILKMMEATSADGYVSCCAALRDMDFRGELPKIALPALVIVGAHDGSTPPDGGRFLAAQIPNAQFVELDAAHFSNVELPELFSETVLKFLS
jgi:3-oxoadipate enol-lactonase